MRFDTVITLIAPAGYTQDDIGQQIPESPVSRIVYANEFTVSKAEYYEAGAQGLHPEAQYQLRACEYEGEQLVSVDGVEYNVIRTEKRGEWVRLTVGRVSGNE